MIDSTYWKFFPGVLGLTEDAIFANCSSAKGNEVLSILTFAELAGMSTGLISNTRVTHATPAAFYCHTPARQWENDQSAQDDCADICKYLSSGLLKLSIACLLQVSLCVSIVNTWRGYTISVSVYLSA